MACSSTCIGPVFSTNARCWRQAQQPSANITAFPQREFRKTKSVNRSFQQEWLIWYEIPAGRLKQSLPGWLFIDHHKGRIQNHIKLRQNKISIHKHIKHTTQVLWLSKVNHLKLRWDKINTLKTYCTETKFYNKLMHFCAITKSNEGSLFACFESLQCPKIVLTVIKKGVFFKSFRGAAPDHTRGAYSAPPLP